MKMVRTWPLFTRLPVGLKQAVRPCRRRTALSGMRTRIVWTGVFGLASILLSATGLYAQSTTYTYHGNPYIYGLASSNYYPGSPTFTGQPPVPPYTTSMSITGEITTGIPIAAGLNASYVGVESATFSDGINLYSASPYAPTKRSAVNVIASTDSNGN